MITNKFQYLFSSTQSNLNADGKRYFNDRISNQKSAIIISDSVEFVFNSVILGDIKYKLEKLSLDMEKYSSVEEYALEEQYRNFSLATGAMPYYACYGSYNSCDSWYCSEIVVENGGNDVLVLIKDRNDDVVRHAYINGGHRYTFNISNGSYIVYFYSGQGWNPRKVISGANCNLHGGFISNENVTKGSYENLQNQQLTYVEKPVPLTTYARIH
jgi:hypothetical protein